MKMLQRLLQDFCLEQALPAHYADMAQQWLIPTIEQIALQQHSSTKTQVIGIHGCQGSGKSTLAALMQQVLSQCHGYTVAVLSIDDFYLTKTERETLANTIHPLFATRGVPGTHDIELLNTTIQQLKNTTDRIAIPRFNKASDDRHPQENWDYSPRADTIILEGWCVGATPQAANELTNPINTLEEKEDAHSIWRNYSNQQLSSDYQELFNTFDSLIMLQAPSFDCVLNWRTKQEEKLRERSNKEKRDTGNNCGLMDDKQLQRFIEHYQRITEHALQTLPAIADTVFVLNEQHMITQQHHNTYD